MSTRARRITIPLTGALPASAAIGATAALTAAAGAAATMPAAVKYNVQEHIGFECSMTAGASGGPWPPSYKSSTRLGRLNGIDSVAWDTDGDDRYDRISSPYFNGDTHKAYKTAADRRTP